MPSNDGAVDEAEEVSKAVIGITKRSVFLGSLASAIFSNMFSDFPHLHADIRTSSQSSSSKLADRSQYGRVLTLRVGFLGSSGRDCHAGSVPSGTTGRK